MAKRTIKRDWNQWLTKNLEKAISTIGETLLVRRTAISCKENDQFGIVLINDEDNELTIERDNRETTVRSKDLVLFVPPYYEFQQSDTDTRYVLVPYSSIKAVFPYDFEEQQEEEEEEIIEEELW